MAKLNAAKRNKLKAGSFALPEKREYPIEDKGHARAALSREHNASPAEQKRITRAVKRKFPGMKVAAHDREKHQPHTRAISHQDGRGK